MDAYTAFKFDFSFDVYISVLAPDGVTSSETFFKSAKGYLAPGAAQTYLYTKEEVPYGSVLRSFKDPSGAAVFEEYDVDVRRYVVASEPVFDFQGNVNGYRQTLKRNPPVVFRGQATD